MTSDDGRLGDRAEKGNAAALPGRRAFWHDRGMSSPSSPQPLSSQDERTWAMAAHLVQLLNFFTGFGGGIAVLVIWLAMRDRSPLVEANGRESLNFQITLLIAAIVGGILCFILVGFLVIAVVLIAQLVLPIVAGLKATEGQAYRYPFTLRLIPGPAPMPPSLP